MNLAPLSIVVLTYNEEKNIAQCLASVAGWAAEVFVVDSFSRDGTVEIARSRGATVFQHEFTGYAEQRNWALSDLSFSNEWVLFLDADETMSAALKEEIAGLDLASQRDVAGYYIKYRFLFMGRWIRHGGYYPTWLMRLFRWKVARCDESSLDEHVFVNGPTEFLKHDLIHHSHQDLTHWIEKHNRYSTLAARDLLKGRKQGEKAPGSGEAGLRVSFWGSQAERKRWIREHLWNRLPPLVRPLLYFLYRYIVRLGFLDGKEGLIFHFLHGFWYRLLIDLKFLEIKRAESPAQTSERASLHDS